MWLKGRRDTFTRLTNSGKSGDPAATLTDRDKWHLRVFAYMRKYITRRAKKAMGVSAII